MCSDCFRFVHKLATRKRESRSSRPRQILSNGVNACTICGNPKKHKPWCSDPNSVPVSILNPAATHPERISTDGIVDDGGVVTNSSIEKVEWVLWSKTCICTKTPRFKPEGDTSWSSKWPTWIYTNHDPSIHPTLSRDPTSNILGSTRVLVLCVHTFWPHLMCQRPILCPECGDIGVALDGWCGGAAFV